MCYDISYRINLDTVSEYFADIVMDDSEQLDLALSGTHIMGHSYGPHPIIYRNTSDQSIHLKNMEWGCIPFYVKDEKQFIRQRASMLNARSERVLDDPKSYWNKIRNRRCLVPVSGFYEHRAIKGWKKKVPYLIRLKRQKTFFLPGLYSVAELPDTSTGEMLKRWTFTIITRNANEVMAQIHNDGDNRGRMPLMLPFELSLQWLDADLDDQSYRKILEFEIPAEELDYYPVYTIRTPKGRPDDKDKDEPWEWEKLPALGELNPD